MKEITRNVITLLSIGVIVVVVFALASATNIFNWKDRVFKSTEQKEIAQLSEKLEVYEDSEKKNEIRKKEIEEHLNDPKIIEEELMNVGKIISLESKIHYKNYIKEEKFLGDRELHLDFTYKFAVGMDLSEITYKIERGEDIIFGEKVVVTVPRNKLKIEYLEREISDKDIEGESGLLVKEFSPEDVNKIYAIAKKQALKQIKNTDEIKFQAYENLKSELSKLIMGLGFKHVEFQE